MEPALAQYQSSRLHGMDCSRKYVIERCFMKEQLEAEKVKSVIDRCYLLSEVAEAIRYVEAGHTQGKVVITVAQ
jgi:NADPH:quinone reductase-like Zn-dependent oxidoreductase